MKFSRLVLAILIPALVFFEISGTGPVFGEEDDESIFLKGGD